MADERRGSRHKRGYDSQWVKVRSMFLADPTNALCCKCRERGLTVPTHDVDHIVPISQGGERLDISNLQPLCRSCHNAKTADQSKLAR